MTVEPGSNIVKLSPGDWAKIAGVAITLAGGLLGVYLHHDRLLTMLVVEQGHTNQRLERIEKKLDQSPSR